MNKEMIITLCMGAAFSVIGFFMIRNEKFARWGVTHGKGRIWAKLLGEERAVKLSRVFFGPLLIVIGLLCLTISFVPGATVTP